MKIKLVGIFLAILGCLGWTTTFAPSVISNLNIEYPLGVLKSIAVDSSGRIYCGIEAYSRIQVYDKNGRYLKGWFIDSSGGSFKIKVDEKDLLHIATARNGIHYIYNVNGELISKQGNRKSYYNEIATDDQQYRFIDREGNTYKIWGFSLLYPRIIKTDSSGIALEIISTPFYKWIFMAPFPSWFFGISGLIILMVQYKDRIPKYW